MKLLAARDAAASLRAPRLILSRQHHSGRGRTTLRKLQLAAGTEVAVASTPQRPAGVSVLLQRFQAAGDAKQAYKLLLQAARELAAFPEGDQLPVNRVLGCMAQVWVTAKLLPDGAVHFSGSSDSELTKGMLGLLVEALKGLRPEEVEQVDPSFLELLQLNSVISGPSRSNGVANMLETMKRRARELTGEVLRFPSLRITANSLEPQGAFAEAQAQFLEPDAQQVDALVTLLSEKRIGVVAHFYMDPEVRERSRQQLQVQGVLSSAAARWPHIHISDSLVMADSAVRMAQAGCQAVAVLGVDFMSENVRAILDQQGFANVPVYRMSEASIGCSLAEAAESAAYGRYLEAAAAQPHSVHVVYINTSLLTKATAQQSLPTITCTSSNVVQTVLQAFAQVPDATVWYGPDTYMGRNLAQLFTSMASWPEEDIKRLHPAHTQASIRALLPRLFYFEQGTCIVHHIFGGQVCDRVRSGYRDSYLTAHFEVPGDMFTLAMEAKQRDMGVVGSTSNILDFISAKVQAALDAGRPDTLRFVLGTEAGMITAIVRQVQSLLRGASPSSPANLVDVEIVFPVESSAITTKQQLPATATNGSAELQPVLPAGLALVPGPASGEGCSLAGGCAACPYMKMNTLAALRQVCERFGSPAGEALLRPFLPREYSESLPDGSSVAQMGCVPILHMRHFQQQKALSDELVQDILGRNHAQAGGSPSSAGQ